MVQETLALSAVTNCPKLAPLLKLAGPSALSFIYEKRVFLFFMKPVWLLLYSFIDMFILVITGQYDVIYPDWWIITHIRTLEEKKQLFFTATYSDLIVLSNSNQTAF